MDGEATSAVSLVTLATMVEELHGLADQLAEMARRNEGLALEVGTLREWQAGQESQIAAREQTIATQADVIAELRRRVEVAEAQLSERSEKAVQAAQGVWTRLRRWWRA